MTDRIITVCIAIFLPLGLLIASRLLDRTSIKEKDKSISDLTSKVSDLLAQKRSADAKAKTAEDVTNLAHSSTDRVNSFADLKAEASKVSSLDDAIALAQKQIDRNNGR